jgi:L-ascorbate metabolism protein UlaG (beta-lactamase superfamily)
MTTKFGKELIAQMNTLRVPEGALAMWGLGQMGVALKGSDDVIVYIDPYLTGTLRSPTYSEINGREFPPPVQPHEVTNAAYVLCSHEHGDHTDAGTLGPIAQSSPNAQFVITGWSQHLLDTANIDPARRLVPAAHTPMQLGSFRLTALPSAHYAVEDDPVKGHRWLGFLIEWNGVTFYHSGDTIIYPGYLDMLKALPPIDVGMLAVNGRDAYRDSYGWTGNLLPLEAAWLSQQLSWDMLIAGHNDLFIWNTVGAGDLSDALRHLNPRQKMHVLQPGELYFYVR